MHTDRGKYGRGMTLLEVMVSLVVLSIAFLGSMAAIRTMSEGMRMEMTVSERRTRGTRAFDDMMADLRRMRWDSDADNFQVLNGGSPAGGTLLIGDEIRFRAPVALDRDSSKVTSWGVKVTYAWKPSPAEDRNDDGIDDTPGVDGDGNGLVDDGVIYRTEEGLGVSIVLTHVPPGGFVVTVDKSKRKLKVKVTSAARTRLAGYKAGGEGIVTEATTEHTYFLRNPQE